MADLRAMLAGMALLLLCAPAHAGEWSGEIAAELRLFPTPPLDDNQHEDNLSLSFDPEYHHAWEDKDMAIVFSPFLRIDQHDSERTHFDIRELFWRKSARDWELRLGIRKVFWGVTESAHIVDIINQTDQVEGPAGEEKLGQPMVNFAWFTDYGTFDFFMLPYFREITFPGPKGRFRTPFLPLEQDAPQFESGAKRHHIDWAARWSHYFGDWDIGLSYFYGTSRDPRITLRFTPEELQVVPRYDIIHQAGIDLQWTRSGWLWKLEAIHREGQSGTFTAAVGGFEYTFPAVLESDVDVGLLAEYLWDSRGFDSETPFESDVFLGTRIALNDVKSTNILAGVIVDPSSGALAWGIEGRRRVGHSFTLDFESRIFSGFPPDDIGTFFRKDDYVEIEFAWHF